MSPYSSKSQESKMRNWEVYKLRGFYQLAKGFVRDEDVLASIKVYVDQELGKLGARTIDEQKAFYEAQYPEVE